MHFRWFPVDMSKAVYDWQFRSQLRRRRSLGRGPGSVTSCRRETVDSLSPRDTRDGTQIAGLRADPARIHNRRPFLALGR